MLFSMNLSMAKSEEQLCLLSFEEFSVCGDYANAIATYGYLKWGADYWNTWFNAYGDCMGFE
jgi:hypothetical protein